jgi:Uma2 family endonuclease
LIVAAPGRNSLQPLQRFVFDGLSWAQYEALLASLGERRLRHTYTKGSLEVVTPSYDHEWSKTLIGDLIATLCRALRLPRQNAGSTTMKREGWERGLEPDECFFVGKKSVAAMRGKTEFDADRDPSPDLVVEIDVTASSDQRIEMYRRMRVPEVWRSKNETIVFLGLSKDGRYRQIKKSRHFPFLSSQELTRFVAMRHELGDDTEVELRFEEWVRQQIKARN